MDMRWGGQGGARSSGNASRIRNTKKGSGPRVIESDHRARLVGEWSRNGQDPPAEPGP